MRLCLEIRFAGKSSFAALMSCFGFELGFKSLLEALESSIFSTF